MDGRSQFAVLVLELIVRVGGVVRLVGDEQGDDEGEDGVASERIAGPRKGLLDDAPVLAGHHLGDLVGIFFHRRDGLLEDARQCLVDDGLVEIAGEGADLLLDRDRVDAGERRTASLVGEIEADSGDQLA